MKKIKVVKISLFCLLAASLGFFVVFFSGKNKEIIKTQAPCSCFFKTIFGIDGSSDALFEELLNSNIMQRLKHIDQSGPTAYFGLVPYFSRYEHSIGVWALLKMAGFSYEEQIAGLLHDASHTVFSHLGDVLFNKKNQNHSYQDTIHLEYLKATGIEKIINKYNLSLELLNPDCGNYKGLEQDLPDMCADRIQYNLQTGLILNLITKQEMEEIIIHLKFNFKQKKWFFDNEKAAVLFAKLPLYLTKNLWGVPWNDVFYHCFSQAIKRAINLNLINFDLVKYGYDQEVIDILKASKDPFIMNLLSKCLNIHNSFVLVDQEDAYDIISKPKCRAIDPLVLKDNQLVRLSLIDTNFKKDLDELKEWCKKGYYCKLK